MTISEAVVLGIIQGITEFLPVSSSGHLLVGKELFGATDVPILFDVLLHVATLVAVTIVFRARIGQLLAVLYRAVTGRRSEEDSPLYRMIAVILVATVVTGILGIAIESVAAVRTPIVASVLFLVTAVTLLLTRWTTGRRGADSLRMWDALLLGVAQGAGVLPGISRSGITISVGLFAGLKRETAGELSFLLAIPAILGALVLTLRDVGALTASISPAAVVAGFAASLLVGLASLRLLLLVVRRGRLALFAIYLVPLGVWGIVHFS